MIRLIIVVIFLIPFLIISLLLQAMVLLIGLFNRPKRDIISLRIVQWAFKVVLSISGTRITYLGEENIPQDGAFLYILNHRSIFDVLVTYSHCPSITGYVAKKEMGKYLTLTWWMKLLYCEFLDRGNMRSGLKSLHNCADKITAGVSMAIFPEGTRNKTDQPLQEFQKGAFKIAERSNCKILPVSINNTEKIFEAHLPLIRSAHVVVEYLPPIDVATLDRDQRKDLPDQVHDMILAAYEKNRAMI